MKTFSVIERRACGLLGLWRSSCRYRNKPDRNQELRQKLTDLAHERPRFGYRRLGVLLAREGQLDHKRLFRLYREAGLSVKRNRHKKLVRTGMIQPAVSTVNEEWSLDFVSDGDRGQVFFQSGSLIVPDHDGLADGRAMRALTVIDNFTRECLALEADTCFSGDRVTRVLDQAIAQRGCPKAIRMDNGLNASDFLKA